MFLALRDKPQGNRYSNAIEKLSRHRNDSFQCSYDTESGDIVGVGVDKAVFTLSDESQVELSTADLFAAFRLGLNSIEEIGAFLLEHKTLEISDLLCVGLVSPETN